VIGLIFWLLTLVVTLKYIFFVLRAGYQGEGGVFALHELVATVKRRSTPLLLLLLVFAASLLLGDGIITPAISVISAVEGLNVATSFFASYIVPIAALILTVLFLVQRKGTAKIGRIFGPLMVVWFLTIGTLGFVQILREPAILAALNPAHALEFAGRIGWHKFLLAMGAIMLAVTGAEALYADMGHFGKRPIRQGWFYLAYWALALNYLGQGAYLLGRHLVVNGNIFFSLLPHVAITPQLTAALPIWAIEALSHAPIYIMVFLATAATIIASQALITGAFSLASQAMALDMVPRLNIIHTSHKHKGQIYIPSINWMLYIGCLVLIFAFRSSSRLAAAYGLAVSGVMVSTTAAMFHIARHRWKWKTLRTVTLFGAFMVIDLTLLTSTSLKFFTGGYVPISIGVLLFAIVLTWHWGRGLVAGAYSAYLTSASPRDMAWLVSAKKRLDKDHVYVEHPRPRRVVELDRAVVFLVSKPVTSLSSDTPIIIRIFLKRHGALPKHIVLLTIVQDKTPFVSAKRRIKVTDFGYNILSVTAHFGFMQNPNGLEILHDLKLNSYLGPDLHRCSVEAAEEELFVSKNTRFIDKLRIRVYLFFKKVSPEAYHYFLMDSKSGLSKTVVPIVLGKNGWRIEIPEFALEDSEEHIDPDTRKPTDVIFARSKANR
jgi:KUP system potassium uptake protein